VATSDYTVTLNGGADAVTAFDCNGASGASGGSSSKVNVTVSTAPTSTSDAWTLSSHTVSDQFGQVEPGTQSKSGFASPAIHLTGLTSTYTGIGGGTGTITLTFSANVVCSSVDADATDFTVTDDFGTTVTLDSVSSCSGSTIVYNYTAGVGGVFPGDIVTATAQNGTDTNTVNSYPYGVFEPVGDSFGAVV